MNKKILAIIFTLIGSIASLQCAHAGSFDPHFYIGGEINTNSPKYNDLTSTKGATTGIISTPHKNKLGGSLLAGLKFTENWGIEGGYNFIKKSTTTNSQNDSVTVKLKNFYFDVMGYIAASEEVDFIASVGIGRLKPSADIENEVITSPPDPNKTKWMLRAGVGALYRFDDNLAARLMVRYQKGKNLIKHNVSAGLGLTWTFI